ncbi:MAG: triose-phosphate isomerase [Candidatus Microbacterium colombiense]|nr:MAG: triose-phosphate isomerase [Microbacterium sp.]
MSARTLGSPFFEIGPKNLLRLPEIISVAEAAGAAGERHGVSVILTVPTALIAPVRAAVPGVFVFAQGIDDDEPGASVARVLPEALADAGAHGVMLNHDASPLTPEAVARAIGRVHSNGLLTMVCAGDDDAVMDLLELTPTIVLYEPPGLIGSTESTDRPWIPTIDRRVAERATDVLMMHAGGVSHPQDAFEIMRVGAHGTGSTSGVLRAESPRMAAAEFIAATRRGFDAHHSATASSPTR